MSSVLIGYHEKARRRAPERRVSHERPTPRRHTASLWVTAGITAAVILLAGIAVMLPAAGGNPNPLAEASSGARIIDIAVLVFREGLESILVLSAITASLVGGTREYRQPITAGAVVGLATTLLTWAIAVRVIDSLAENLSALNVQAATGLLAIAVLLVVMNWFFHRVYWTGWIGAHTRRKQRLVSGAKGRSISARRALFGLALLGFTSIYREGFEIVLFLQSYRLKLGGSVVLEGVAVGLALTLAVAVLTFALHRRLPYKRMLVLTGVLLALVLLVMVGEQVQEMQLAQWIGTTTIPALEHIIPDWMGLWFAVFPTVQSLSAQLVAALAVFGSYAVARYRVRRLAA
jgi:high-affinity iron transporter